MHCRRTSFGYSNCATSQTAARGAGDSGVGDTFGQVQWERTELRDAEKRYNKILAGGLDRSRCQASHWQISGGGC